MANNEQRRCNWNTVAAAYTKTPSKLLQPYILNTYNAIQQPILYYLNHCVAVVQSGNAACLLVTVAACPKLD